MKDLYFELNVSSSVPTPASRVTREENQGPEPYDKPPTVDSREVRERVEKIDNLFVWEF
jgi:hypothetical protein